MQYQGRVETGRVLFSAHILRKTYPVALQPEVCCLGVDLSRGIVKRLPPFLPRVWPHFPFPWKLSDFKSFKENVGNWFWGTR